MTLYFILLWAFIWNIVGATIGLIPIGVIFLISRTLTRIIYLIKYLFKIKARDLNGV